MPEIAVPESSYPALRSLTDLTPEEFSTLLSAITNAQPAARSDVFLDHVCARAPRIKSSTVREIVRELFSLISVKESFDMSDVEFADSLAKSTLGDQSRNLRFEEADKALLKERLIKLLALKSSLGMTAKTLDLLTDAQHLFYSSKILRDVRPAFNEEGSVAEGAIILHNLRIYYGDSEYQRNFFVTLDANDLQQLRKVISRAEQKAEVLKAVLKRADIRFLDVQEK